jgi:hypothetical protein
MNKKLVFAALSALMFAGCEEFNIDNPIVDWNPVNIYIYATDSTGNSIIQPDMPGMSLTFKNETYTVRDWSEKYDSIIYTRAYLAILYGLFAEPYYDDNDSLQYRLSFGEIDGAADMDEDITLSWPDGSTDVIHYHCSDHNERKLSCKRTWKLNGKKHDSGIFHFTNK